MFGRERESGYMADIASAATRYGVPAAMLTELVMGTAQAREITGNEQSEITEKIQEIKERNGEELAGKFEFAGKQWTVSGAELRTKTATSIAFTCKYSGDPGTPADDITLYSSYSYRGELPEHQPGTPNTLVTWDHDWRYGSKDAFKVFQADMVSVGKAMIADDPTSEKKGNFVQHAAIGLAYLNALALASSGAPDTTNVIRHVHWNGKGWWQGDKEPLKVTGGPSFSITHKETPRANNDDSDPRFDYQRAQGSTGSTREIRKPDAEITIGKDGVTTQVSDTFAKKYEIPDTNTTENPAPSDEDVVSKDFFREEVDE